MSDYSSTYPTQSPVFAFDAKAGKLDSRLSYSRSSGGTYMSSERHLSSLNLLKYSTAFDNSAWTTNNMPAPTTGQTDPSGGTGGCILIADTTNGSHNKFQSQVVSGDLCFTVYAKPAAGTMRMMLNLYKTTNDWEVFLFDLVGGTPVAASGTSSTFGNVSATQTASGNGYYKCTIKATGSITSALLSLNPNATTSGLDAYGDISFAGDGTAGITVAFASLSTVGSSDYNATTSQIHREFAPLLKTAAANAPRFEFDESGNAKGLLIESQGTNLQRYGSGFASWSGQNRVTTTSNVAIAPNGLLEADLIAANTSATQTHNVSDNESVIVSGTVYTGSVYVKDFGQRYVQIVGGSSSFGSSQWATFDLQTGSVDVNGVTASAVSVGNGWYRIQTTMTSTAAGAGAMVIGLANSATATRLPLFAGNDYDGVLVWGFQLETGSSASSLVDTGTGSSSATRAADSCSVALNGILASGQDVTLYAEGDWGDYTVKPYNRFLATLSENTDPSWIALYNANSSGASYIKYLNNLEAVQTGVAANGNQKAAVSVAMNSINHAAAGVASAEDTSATVPPYTQLNIGNNRDAGTLSLNGHCTRVALYGQALSSSELVALTS